MKTMKSVLLILITLPIAVLVSSGAASAQSKLEASIFSYDGKDFVRTNTTLMDKGKSATGTKLDQSSEAYKALSQKHSYSGPATVFGQNYDGSYAPLTDASGKLTGALFVGVPK
jgi:adenosylcobinamide amidohydrolase